MSLNLFLLYITSVIALTASPGPMVFLAVKHGMLYGKTGAFLSAATGVCCISLMLLLCFLGISQLLNTYAILKILLMAVGGLYLFYLGAMALFQSPRSATNLHKTQHPLGNIPRQKIIKEMALVAWTNPKDWIFFGLFLPQFISVESAMLPQLTIFVLTFALSEFFFLSFFGVGSHYLTGRLRLYSVIAQKLFGIVFLFIGGGTIYHLLTTLILQE